jgi:uncharacterized membrane protein
MERTLPTTLNQPITKPLTKPLTKSERQANPAPLEKSMTCGALLPKRSIIERIFHAMVFEAIAIALTSVFLVWIMQQTLSDAGGLAIVISLTAMLWNMVFNAAFDRAQARMAFQRTVGVRAVHALIFEIGLTLVVVPLAAWWLDIRLLEALILDIGLLAFFLFYTFVYNWTYDILRARWVARTAAGAQVVAKACSR